MGLNEFKNNFNGGTRTNRFKISCKLPDVAGGVEAFTEFHIRATTIPSVSTKNIAFDYLGRKFNYPGEREYGTWSFQVLDDVPTEENDSIWKKLQTWQNSINAHTSNTTSYTAANYDYYKADLTISQLDLNATKTVKEFKLIGAWPAGILPISFNMGNPNLLNTFNVIMVYDYVEIDGTITETTETTRD